MVSKESPFCCFFLVQAPALIEIEGAEVAVNIMLQNSDETPLEDLEDSKIRSKY
jgi:hypothetical protein